MRYGYEHPDVSRALRTGYGYGSEEAYELEQTFYYSTDVGEMDERETLAYMLEYIRENFADAVEMFGFEVRRRAVPCDAYGDLL